MLKYIDKLRSDPSYPPPKELHVFTHSSGNFAQAVSWPLIACQAVGLTRLATFPIDMYTDCLFGEEPLDSLTHHQGHHHHATHGTQEQAGWGHRVWSPSGRLRKRLSSRGVRGGDDKGMSEQSLMCSSINVADSFEKPLSTS